MSAPLTETSPGVMLLCFDRVANPTALRDRLREDRHVYMADVVTETGSVYLAVLVRIDLDQRQYEYLFKPLRRYFWQHYGLKARRIGDTGPVGSPVEFRPGCGNAAAEPFALPEGRWTRTRGFPRDRRSSSSMPCHVAELDLRAANGEELL
jgi:hypothetical protein